MIFRRFSPFIYIYMHIYNKFITSNEILFWEILLPSLDLIKYVHDVINLLKYKHWTDKWNYTPYISVTHKALKSCRSKMATLAHDVSDVHGASVLYIYKNLLARFVQGFLYWEDGGAPPSTKNLLIHPLHTKFLFPPTESQFNLIKK